MATSSVQDILQLSDQELNDKVNNDLDSMITARSGPLQQGQTIENVVKSNGIKLRKTVSIVNEVNDYKIDSEKQCNLYESSKLRSCASAKKCWESITELLLFIFNNNLKGKINATDLDIIESLTTKLLLFIDTVHDFSKADSDSNFMCGTRSNIILIAVTNLNELLSNLNELLSKLKSTNGSNLPSPFSQALNNLITQNITFTGQMFASKFEETLLDTIHDATTKISSSGQYQPIMKILSFDFFKTKNSVGSPLDDNTFKYIHRINNLGWAIDAIGHKEKFLVKKMLHPFRRLYLITSLFDGSQDNSPDGNYVIDKIIDQDKVVKQFKEFTFYGHLLSSKDQTPIEYKYDRDAGLVISRNFPDKYGRGSTVIDEASKKMECKCNYVHGGNYICDIKGDCPYFRIDNISKSYNGDYHGLYDSIRSLITRAMSYQHNINQTPTQVSKAQAKIAKAQAQAQAQAQAPTPVSKAQAKIAKAQAKKAKAQAKISFLKSLEMISRKTKYLNLLRTKLNEAVKNKTLKDTELIKNLKQDIDDLRLSWFVEFINQQGGSSSSSGSGDTDPQEKLMDSVEFFITLKSLGDYAQCREAMARDCVLLTQDRMMFIIGCKIGAKMILGSPKNWVKSNSKFIDTNKGFTTVQKGGNWPGPHNFYVSKSLYEYLEAPVQQSESPKIELIKTSFNDSLAKYKPNKSTFKLEYNNLYLKPEYSNQIKVLINSEIKKFEFIYNNIRNINQLLIQDPALSNPQTVTQIRDEIKSSEITRFVTEVNENLKRIQNESQSTSKDEQETKKAADSLLSKANLEVSKLHLTIPQDVQVVIKESIFSNDTLWLINYYIKPPKIPVDTYPAITDALRLFYDLKCKEYLKKILTIYGISFNSEPDVKDTLKKFLKLCLNTKEYISNLLQLYTLLFDIYITPTQAITILSPWFTIQHSPLKVQTTAAASTIKVKITNTDIIKIFEDTNKQYDKLANFLYQTPAAAAPPAAAAANINNDDETDADKTEIDEDEIDQDEIDEDEIDEDEIDEDYVLPIKAEKHQIDDTPVQSLTKKPKKQDSTASTSSTASGGWGI